MEQVILNLQQPYAGKMQTLLKVFGSTDLLVDKFMDYHVNRLKREIIRMKSSLKKYELKYKIKSDKFYTKIENGELDDKRDFVMWSGIYELLLDSEKQLAQII